MKLTLHNFMKHADLNISFNPGEVILLTGDSEIGKSSILLSILWCMYGKVSKVYQGESKKVWVKMEIDDLIIYRQARPGKIEVTNIKTKSKYSGSAAQSIINDRYHNKDVWLASSYIEQKKKSFLMESGYEERMKILHSIAFEDEDPEKYIKQIDELKSIYEQKYSKLLTEHEVLADLYQKEYERESKNTNSNIFSEIKDYKTTLEQLKRLNEDYPELDLKYKQNSNNIVKSDILNQQIQTLQKKYKKIVSVQSSRNVETINIKIKELEDTIRSFNSNFEHKQKYEKLERQIKSIRVKVVLNSELVTTDNFMQTKQLELDYTSGIKLAKTLKIEYSPDKIKYGISKLEQQMKTHSVLSSKIPLLKELKLLERKLSYISPIPEEITIERVNNEKKKYDEMKRGVDLLNCPHCNKSVRYKNNKLIPSDLSIISKEELKKQFDLTKKVYKQHNEFKNYIEIKTKIENLSSKIENRELVESVSKINIKTIIKRLTDISKLNYCTKPDITSITIRKNLDLKKFKDQIGDIKFDPIVSKLDINTLKKELNCYSKELEVERNRIYSINKFKKDIEIIEKSLENITIDSEIEYKRNNSLDKIESYKSKIVKLLSLIKQKDSLSVIDTLKTKINKIKHKLEIIHQIKQKAINLNCKMLDDTIRTINGTMNPILESIFEKSVILELKLFKKMKVGRKTKQMVNLDILFDTTKHEKRLCGGEEDRISIAIMLAMNQISRSPFILMDELMGTVSPRIAKKCFKQIKEYTGNDRYTICIEHNVVRGLYDRVIDFNTFLKK